MSQTMEAVAVNVTKEEKAEILEKANAKTWDGLSRMAFAANWDPENAIDWNQPIELGMAGIGNHPTPHEQSRP
jgi:hypothetical protein